MKTPEIIIKAEPGNTRFRYPCDYLKGEKQEFDILGILQEIKWMQSGSVKGIKEDGTAARFPEIEILGYEGNAIIHVFCVEEKDEFSIHPHLLTGENNVDGIIYKKHVVVTPGESIKLNFSILSTKKKHTVTVMNQQKQHYSKLLKNFKYRGLSSHSKSGNNYDLNSVKLCYLVMLKDGSDRILTPKFTRVIRNVRSNKELKIVKMFKDKAPLEGGQRLDLYCTNFTHGDEVRFAYEKDGQEKTFSVTENLFIHKECAVSFVSPAFPEPNIKSTVNAKIYLVRKTDQFESPRLNFEFYNVFEDLVDSFALSSIDNVNQTEQDLESTISNDDEELNSSNPDVQLQEPSNIPVSPVFHGINDNHIEISDISKIASIQPVEENVQNCDFGSTTIEELSPIEAETVSTYTVDGVQYVQLVFTQEQTGGEINSNDNQLVQLPKPSNDFDDHSDESSNSSPDSESRQNRKKRTSGQAKNVQPGAIEALSIGTIEAPPKRSNSQPIETVQKESFFMDQAGTLVTLDLSDILAPNNSPNTASFLRMEEFVPLNRTNSDSSSESGNGSPEMKIELCRSLETPPNFSIDHLNQVQPMAIHSI